MGNYGNLADHHEILKRLERVIELLEHLVISAKITEAKPKCDGTCGEKD